MKYQSIYSQHPKEQGRSLQRAVCKLGRTSGESGGRERAKVWRGRWCSSRNVNGLRPKKIDDKNLSPRDSGVPKGTLKREFGTEEQGSGPMMGLKPK